MLQVYKHIILILILFANMSLELEDKKDGGDSFAVRLATKIVDNLQIEITDVHIRYEDDVTDPKVKFSLTNIYV